jgi:hypothetical protein
MLSLSSSSLVKGLGPDSAACIRTYKRLAQEEDPTMVKEFLADLIRGGKNKFLLLIITSGVSRIRNRDRELDILDYLYCSKGLANHLRIYANTRCCYKICDKRDKVLAKKFIQRGYEALHLKWSCPPSDNPRWDPTHLGFSVMLAMLNVYMVYGWLKQAHHFTSAAIAIASDISESSINQSFYGTTTRIAKIIGIYYLLGIRGGNSIEYAEKCQTVLRKVFANGILVADSSVTRYLEFTESLSVYQSIIEHLDGECDKKKVVEQLVDICILAGPRAKKRVMRKLGCSTLVQSANSGPH